MKIGEAARILVNEPNDEGMKAVLRRLLEAKDCAVRSLIYVPIQSNSGIEASLPHMWSRFIIDGTVFVPESEEWRCSTCKLVHYGEGPLPSSPTCAEKTAENLIRQVHRI